MLDLQREVEELGAELRKALDDVLRSGRFILGPQGAAFEREIARYLDVPFAVGLNSGTDALVLGLRALGVGAGDEVVTTPFTFVATGEAILRVGARPVFADIEPGGFNINPARVESRIGPRTRAILPVHLFGLPADLDALRSIAESRRIPLFEDTAQAFGADFGGRRAGSIGAAAAFSFYPSKNLGAYGDAGLFATRSADVAERVIKLRNHGARDKYEPELLGANSRLDELQAAILRVKLPHVDGWNDARRRVAQRYSAGFADVAGVVTPREPAGRSHVFHQYTLRILGGRRDRVRARLTEAGIATATFYSTPLHRIEIFADPKASLPEATRAAAEVLCLPMGHYQTPGVTDRVIETVRAAL
jgi:dTDP-4-amino-4,6-dideoxygalactose transaminase